jgi:hypothetical protein
MNVPDDSSIIGIVMNIGYRFELPAGEQKKLKAEKMLKKRGKSYLSSAHFFVCV